MGRMLVAGAALAAMLAISPACDKKPRITAQPLAEKTMIEKATADSVTVKTAPWIDSLLTKVPTKYSAIARETAGSRRIKIELENAPRQADAYGRKYNELVSDVSDVLKHEYRGFPWNRLSRPLADALDGLLDLLGRKSQMDEEKFITGIENIMHFTNHKGRNKNGYMSESLCTGKFNCTTSSFLVFDVARELHINMEIVFVWKHQLVKTQNFFFETILGGHYPLEKVHEHYQVIETITSDPEKIQSIAYNCRGLSYYNRGRLWRAIRDFNKAVELNPKCATCCRLRGDAYEDLGETRLALKDYSKAIEADSLVAELYNLRGISYHNLGNVPNDRGKLWLAVKDFTKAIKLEPKNWVYYGNRADAYFRLGMKKASEADGKKYTVLYWP
jgi:tetratricopeptide (TPR) repeat protein